MNKHVGTIAMAGVLMVALAGCTKRQLFSPQEFQPVQLDAAAYARRIDSFIIVMDVSPWMEGNYRKQRDFERVKEIVSRLNRTIPPLDYQAGLVVSGSGTCWGCEDAGLLYGLAPYNSADLQAVLSGIKKTSEVNRLGPMSEILEFRRTDAQEDLGRMALIIVSDADNHSLNRTIKFAQKMKGTAGDKLCIYPIQVGRDAGGYQLMTLLAKIGGCGFAVNADEIAAPQDMADYVTRVFLAPPAAPPAMVPLTGVKDSDGDGVPDSRDKCPDSPPGIRIGPDGCWAPAGVYFDSDKTAIKDTAPLDEAVSVLKAHPGLTLNLEGYTDDTAGPDYNLRLSVARAEAVRGYLVQQGIAPARIRTQGFGEARSAASNGTAEGRALNRRVELHPEGM